MGQRPIEILDDLNQNGTGTESVEATPDVLVELNYPEPTPLGVILRDVARWSGQSFVMEPSVNAKLQIFSPRKQSKAQAWELFLTSLSVVGLRAVQIGRVVKVVPAGFPVGA